MKQPTPRKTAYAQQRRRAGPLLRSRAPPVISPFLLAFGGLVGRVAASIETATILQQKGPAALSVQAKVERGQVDIRLADSIRLTLTVDGSAQLQVKPGAIQPSEAIKVRKRSAPEITAAGKDRRHWQQTFQLEPLVPGNHTVQLDPLEYREKPGNWTTVPWQPVPVKVTTQIKSADASDIHDITDIEELPARPSPWLGLAWGLASIGGMVLMLVVIRQWRKRRRQAAPPLTPREWAGRELDRVLALALPAR